MSPNNKGRKTLIQTRRLVAKGATSTIFLRRKKLILAEPGNETKKSTKTIEKE